MKPRPIAVSPLMKVLAAAAVAAIASLVACNSIEGATPECAGKKEGCQEFAVCEKGAPEKCCVDSKGKPFEGSELTDCLYGYGVPMPTSNTGGAGGTGGTGGKDGG